MNLVAWLLVLFFGRLQGRDSSGNRYYTLSIKNIGRERRCVLFSGKKEPSKIMGAYDLWLRHMIDKFPKEEQIYSWQKSKLPNLTGTKFAFNPSDYNKSIRSYDDYTSWKGK